MFMNWHNTPYTIKNITEGVSNKNVYVTTSFTRTHARTHIHTQSSNNINILRFHLYNNIYTHACTHMAHIQTCLDIVKTNILTKFHQKSDCKSGLSSVNKSFLRFDLVT